MSNWQNRITGYKEVPVSELLANPLNARRHPPAQRDALRGSLDTLGWVAPVIVNSDGFMLDGHARVEELLTKDDSALIPVIEVDITADEAKLFLASFDWITQLAIYDTDATDALLQSVNTDDERLQAMLAGMAEDMGIIPPDFMPVDMSEQPRLDQLEPKMVTCPCCGETFDLRDVES